MTGAYRLEIQRRALKELGKLDAQVRRRISAAIDQLAGDPRPSGCKKLVGRDAWRIRVGDHRVIYEIEDDVVLVRVVRVAHRREVYE
ncbi:mRNA interferase RelE/StbE [Isoptericola sp. CG 20/1183]|uniref:mRNA interferase RelE/StbE n=1 Tax=Isoptericola halotolerans TaxID=300560 RepID=A0ABX5E9K9_9MICO|nr:MULTISPECIES: type II toxin-antitoxin system RelE/ParE family toxin [Isoptericola]MCK0115840.1 type II toxin-antitoxin system RelE/ParE family toxin [Isoptericola sp. S6320L]PRZ02732.1 mRNA interferase RelE/StbE [Isoptericola sp. CG 20/1183]PRZ03188.1 mRNA interferase RelE/StbE [Isoptericola halotolerans]